MEVFAFDKCIGFAKKLAHVRIYETLSCFCGKAQRAGFEPQTSRLQCTHHWLISYQFEQCNRTVYCQTLIPVC